MAEPFGDLKEALCDRYRFDRELGHGGMAVVFLARDLKHDRDVAIKVVRPELAALMGAERFLREVTIAAQLQHPHILTLIDSGEARAAGEPEGRPYLYYVMPRIQGETLRERLEREGKLAPATTARILRDVLDALAHAHQAGFVHRDIKPENIMLAGRHAMVMDFGIARAMADSQPLDTAPKETLTTLGMVIGTPAYMSPEQAAGDRDLDHRTDLYAVGVMGYEMLSGRTPFTGSTPQAILAGQIGKAPPPLGEAAPEVPLPLAAAIMRCLEKDPADRWPSAESLLEALDSFAPGDSGSTTAGRPAKRSRPALIGAGILAALMLGGLWFFGPGKRAREVRWAREEGIPQLLALGDSGAYDSAFVLARRVEAAIPGDSLFNALRPRFARRISLRTIPPGATVRTKPYGASDSAWILLGRTPLDSVLVPRASSGFINPTRFRVEAPEFRTLDLAWLPFGDSIMLDPDSEIPAEMVRVRGGALNLGYGAGLASAPTIELGDFLMDRLEVTNAEYRAFVDSGGYRRLELWEHPFTKDGRTLTWNQAMALMTDKTGRPGPANWEAGDYPADQGGYPVGGLSWYEAAAYAKFRGKALPSVYHWQHAATLPLAASINARSNFSSAGPRVGGREENLSGFGTYDMAGNVREWCANASGTERFILGGGWTDQVYQFTDNYTQHPFDRSPINGVRLVKYRPGDPNLAQAFQPIERHRRNFLAEPRTPDAVFEAYRRMYDYDRTPLDAQVVEQVDEGDWTRELVRVRAAYGTDTLLAYLYLPHRGKSPWPVVVYYPGSSAIGDVAPRNLQWNAFDFVLRSGRAVLYPVYKGTYQRSDSLNTDVQNSSSFYRDHVIMWAKDLRRAVDYAETREELAVDQLAYYGLSWGGAMGAIMPVVEPRIKTSVLYVAGLDFERTRPEVDPVNFLSRNRIPTLMLNGRYDFFFPLETSQVPMFKLLGTPPDQKRHVVEDGSHNVPRLRLVQEILAWLDRYQPVPH